MITQAYDDKLKALRHVLRYRYGIRNEYMNIVLGGQKMQFVIYGVDGNMLNGYLCGIPYDNCNVEVTIHYKDLFDFKYGCRKRR